MPRFTVRVQFHGVEREDYKPFYEAMEREGFSKFIVGRSGRTFQLPWAEYAFEGDISKEEVRRRAKLAAEEITERGDIQILVTQSAGRCWAGLQDAGEYEEEE